MLPNIGVCDSQHIQNFALSMKKGVASVLVPVVGLADTAAAAAVVIDILAAVAAVVVSDPAPAYQTVYPVPAYPAYPAAALVAAVETAPQDIAKARPSSHQARPKISIL